MYLSFTSLYAKNISCVTFEFIMFSCFYKASVFYFSLSEYGQPFPELITDHTTILGTGNLLGPPKWQEHG